MKKAKRGWLLPISHNTRSGELYMRFSSGILKQTEERTFSYSVSFIWCSTERHIMEARNTTGWKAIRQINERKICWELFNTMTSVQAPGQAVPCQCWLEAGSLNQENFHFIIFVLVFFFCCWSRRMNECLCGYLGWAVAAISTFLHFQEPLQHQSAHENP